MITRELASQVSGGAAESARLEAAGHQAARSTKSANLTRHDLKRLRHEAVAMLQDVNTLAARHDLSQENRKWVTDNYRLLRTAARDVRDGAAALEGIPGVVDAEACTIPRIYSIAHDHLRAAIDRFSEEGLVAWLKGYQAVAELQMGEIWGLKPALQLALLKRITTPGSIPLAPFITSLRHIGETQWKDVFEASSVVDRIFVQAPGSEFAAMEYESRELYRTAVTAFAKRCPLSERDIAEMVVANATSAREKSDGSTAAVRRSCIGYYLIGEGAQDIREAAGYVPAASDRVRDFVYRFPNGFYLIGVEILTLIIVYSLLGRLETLTPIVAGFFLLLLPATQAAVDFMNNLVGYILPPRVIPKLDFLNGIPADCTTMVAVPTLLLKEAQVRDLVLDLEIRYLANRDPNLLFALLTDSPDTQEPAEEEHPLLALAVELIEGLNARYGTEGRTPFYMFHRHRVFNPVEGRWMGWERKRGKLLDLNQLLRGGFDSFPIKVGDLSALPNVRFVITLDSDTQLPRDAASRLVGTMAHPLNRAVIDPDSKMVVEGYGILQPRIGISIQSASRSRLAAVYSGQTGFDIYTRAISDVYQDLFGEGIFTGKGIYDVDALHESLHWRFPENALLSHDLIEGSYARAGLVSDIELIDDYPSHFSAYSRRKHRWVRGDWQIMRWLFPNVPDARGAMIDNPIGLTSRWKILDNLRRSLIEPATLLLLLAGWFYLPGDTLYWTLASVGMILMPVYANLLFSLLRAPWGRAGFGAWSLDLCKTVLNGHIVAILSIVFLLHQSLLSLDAIFRSVLRVFVIRRRLLEWETAAEAENATQQKATVDQYLEWTPAISLLIGAALWFLRPGAFVVAAPILFGWLVSRALSAWLNRAPRSRTRDLKKEDQQFLTDSAERILRFFDEWSTPANHYLIPDNVREDGAVAQRLSPTNVGLLLNARIAAVHFGKLSIPDFTSFIEHTLSTVRQLEKYRGHLFNWYDVESLQVLAPRFISTVDSGNLVACYWTLKQAAIEFARKCPELADRLADIAAQCDRLVQEMDFSFLYHQRKKVLSVGFDVDAGQLERSAYDLLASESRIACFVAIAKGDIPKEAWFHLGRRHTAVRGERVLVSWTGTMFEYLMPVLWMRHHPGTILHEALCSMLGVQKDYARRKGVPWGISESACKNEGECEYGYAAFGIPELAMKQPETDSLVISPYSTFLALPVDPHAAVENLRRMEAFGWSGRYGFYEAIDYTHAGGEVIRSWMAHHQGMSLLAICNLLFESPMQRDFHAEPQALATELLLHERVPTAVVAEAEELPAAVAAV